MSKNIIVIGGYGCVGQIICRELAKYFPKKIYAAGRSLKKATAFSNETNGIVQPLELDTTKPFQKKHVENATLIIMCLDQPNTDYVKAILKEGIHYVDITAGNEFLSQAELLNNVAMQSGSTALLSVGLTPGLSNLMALEASKQLDSVDTLDIGIMLGLGDHHGSAAIQWTLDIMNQTFLWNNHGTSQQAESFRDGKVFYFGKHFGYKKAYHFPFSDQHTLSKTLQIPAVKTHLCFDSSVLTKLIAFMKKTGLLKILKIPFFYRLTEKSMSKFSLGTDAYALKIEASGIREGKNKKIELMIQGREEAKITGLAAAYVAKALYETKQPNGVYHIEQLFDLSVLPLDIREKIQFL